jgi:hypothetical protein
MSTKHAGKSTTGAKGNPHPHHNLQKPLDSGITTWSCNNGTCTGCGKLYNDSLTPLAIVLFIGWVGGGFMWFSHSNETAGKVLVGIGTLCAVLMLVFHAISCKTKQKGS